MSKINIKVKNLIDLALGGPEDGIVNFNLIHTILYIFAQHLDLLETKIDFEGHDSAVIKSLIDSGIYNSNMQISVVSMNDKTLKKTENKPVAQKKHSNNLNNKSNSNKTGKQSKNNSGNIEHKQHATKKLNTIAEESASDNMHNDNSSEGNKDANNDEVLENTENKAEYEEVEKNLQSENENITKDTNHDDGSNVSEQPDDETHDLVTNKSKETKSREKSSKAKVDNKSVTLLKISQNRLSVVSSTDKSNDEDDGSISKQISKSITNTEIIKSIRSQSGPKSVSEMWQLLNISARLEALESGIDKVSSIVEDLAMEYKKVKSTIGISDVNDPQNIDDDAEGENRKESNVLALLDKLTHESASLDGEIKQIRQEFLDLKDKNKENMHKLQTAKASDIDEKILQHINKLDTSFNNQINDIHNQIAELDKGILEIWKMNETQEPNMIQSKLEEIESNINICDDKISKLLEEKSVEIKSLDAFSEELHLLSRTKVDITDFENVIKGKADIEVVEMKMSIAIFDSIHIELLNKLKNNETQIIVQEEVIKQKTDKLYEEIKNKINNEEFLTFKISFDDEIKCLQNKLKTLEIIKKETEAAISSRYLRDVNCISCGTNVISSKFEYLPPFEIFKAWSNQSASLKKNGNSKIKN